METANPPLTAQVEDDLRLWVMATALPAACHVVLAIFFYVQGLPAYGHSDVVATLVHLTGLACVLLGRRFLGLWIVAVSGCLHLVFFLIAMGPAAGWAYYFLALLVFPLVFMRRHVGQMASALALLAVATVAALAGTSFVDPWLTFEPRVLHIIHGTNLVLSLGCIVAAAVAILNGDRRHRAELARLREEVLEARKLGQYTLADKLGAGGMGQVFRATHALLRRPVAIKLIKDGEVSDASLRRFEREVQRTSELTHPNTIEIYDYGRTPEGIFYYVMEYLDGLDLERLVTGHGAQPAGRVIHLWTQACEALEEAHERGLVHRDIKPANLLLCRRGMRPDVVKVLDFGLVKESGNDGATIDQGIAGTPAYLAPEAVTDPQNVTPAADLYALGAVAYFLLCGETVFDKKSFFELCTAHLEETPRPIGERAPTPIPAELEELVMGCLEKDPTKRPNSARALRLALEAIALDDPWTEAKAAAWWDEFEARRAPRSTVEASRAPRDAHDLDATLGATIDAGVVQRAQWDNAAQ